MSVFFYGSHRDEPLLRQAVSMGEDIVFRGGVKTGGVLQLGDLLKGPPAHDGDVHLTVEAIVVRLFRNTILAPLLERDMVDHLILQVAPVLLGEGIPLFTQKAALKLGSFALQEGGILRPSRIPADKYRFL